MAASRKGFSNSSVLVILLFAVTFTKAVQFRGGGTPAEVTTQKYFPFEKTLFVVLGNSEGVADLPTFHVPVVVFTRDQVLQDCERKLRDQDEDGYVFVSSTNPATLEEQILPLLKCCNRTTPKLKTRYILVIDSSKDGNSNREEIYSSFFQNLWNVFGIINIAILPFKDQGLLNSDPLHIISYNLFLLGHTSNPSALVKSILTEDIRGVMVGRFRNMHGHPLRAVFYRDQNFFLTLEKFNERQTLGADPGVLLKQSLEERLNARFDVYEYSSGDIYGTDNETGVLGDVSSGRAEYAVTLMLLPPGVLLAKKLQTIATDFSLDFVFVVPKPREIESWRFFEYIFQWQVCVGLGLVLFLLSVSALLFQYVHSNSGSHTSPVVSVWKAALSVSVKRLPTTHSQRLLIAWSLILGLIFLTLFSVQLFALMKSKPRMPSIKTLQDLHDSDLPIYVIHNVFAPYLNSFENTSFHRFKDNLRTDKTYENAYFLNPQFLNVSGRAVMYTTIILQLIMSQPRNRVFLEYFEVVKEPVFQDLSQLCLPMGSIYFDLFNELSLRLRSGGIYRKWVDANTYVLKQGYIASSSDPRTPASSSSSSYQSGDNRVPLTYDDLRMAFYILYIGLTVSAVYFVKELCDR